MAELDEMAQAAITGQRTCVTDPGPSIPPLSRKPVVKPQSAPAYNTSTPAGRVTFKYPVGPGVSDISLLRHSDTSSSKNSSNTTYPSSLSNSRRSTSLSSHDNSSKSGEGCSMKDYQGEVEHHLLLDTPSPPPPPENQF